MDNPGKIFLFFLFLIVGIVLFTGSFIPSNYFLEFSNNFSEDGVCDSCSLDNIMILKVILLFAGLILLSLTFFINGIYKYLSKVSYNIFGFKFFIFLFLIAFIIRMYNLGYHSLFVDEAWVANSILEPTIKEMVFYKDYVQTTPVLFLIATRAFVEIFGKNDLIFRLLPFSFGVLSVILMYLISKRFTKNEIISLVTTSLFAFNWAMISYSQLLKQYTGDVFFVLLLIYITELFIETFSLKHFLILVAVSIIGLVFSNTLIFLIPAISIRVILSYLKKNKLRFSIKNNIKIKKIILVLLAYNTIIGIVFGLNYLFFIFPTRIPLVLDYWDAGFVNDYGIIPIFSFLIKQSYSFFTFFFRIPALMLILFLLGVYFSLSKVEYKGVRDFMVYFSATVFFVLSAAFLKEYPYGGSRASLFMGTFIFMFIAIGMYHLIMKLKLDKFIKISLLIILIISPMIFATAVNFLIPQQNEEIRPVVEYYSGNALPGDITYINCGKTAFKYYYGIDNENILIRDPSVSKTDIMGLDKAIQKASDNRLWIIFSHCEKDEEEIILDHTKKYCIPMSSFKSVGASANLFLC